MNEPIYICNYCGIEYDIDNSDAEYYELYCSEQCENEDNELEAA